MGGARAITQTALQAHARDALANHTPPTAAQSQALTSAISERRAELAALPKKIALGRASYAVAMPENAKPEVEFWNLIWASGVIAEIIGSLIAGMGLFKVGFFSASWRVTHYLALAIIGNAISIPTTLVDLHHSAELGFRDEAVATWMFLPYGLQQISGMIANACCILVFIRLRLFRSFQARLADVGRMALTNYIGTTLICKFLFSWSPLKLYARLEYYQDIYVVAGIWLVNLGFSAVWMSRFKFGPLEWL